MLEEERKYAVGPDFTVPDLLAAIPGGRVVRQPPLTLRATYHDTADLRLTRSGVSLRYRRGEPGPPWTVKLPSGEGSGIRREITAKGLASWIPEELSQVVLGYSRGVSLSPVANLRTERRAYRVYDAAGALLAEVADDTVSVLEGRRAVSRFRELEVERAGADREMLDRIERVLVDAGAKPGRFIAKQVRALGPLAAEPPDLPATQPLGHQPSAADLLIEELRRETGRLLRCDPVVRLAPEDPDSMEQLRLACRRLRTDLRVFSPLFAGTPYHGNGPASRRRAVDGTELVEPLRDLAGAVRGVVGPRAMRARLGAIEVSDIDAEAAGRLDGVLAGAASRAGEDLAALMAAESYTRMLDGLIATARVPRLQDPAHAAATEVLPALAATFWERLAAATDILTLRSAPQDWRTARRAARRVRRLSRLAVPVVGRPALLLAEALDPVVALLDVEREATRARAAWLAASDAAPQDRAMAITVGRLVEREHVLAAAAREAFRAAWHEQKWRTATEWLV